MGHKFSFVIYFCKNMHTRRSYQDLESDQHMDCSHTSQLSIPSKIVLYGHIERKLCLIRKDVHGYGMTGNNFVSYFLFSSSLLYFLGPMACWTTVMIVTQVQKA